VPGSGVARKQETAIVLMKHASRLRATFPVFPPAPASSGRAAQV
jgi:hypothetical protein